MNYELPLNIAGTVGHGLLTGLATFTSVNSFANDLPQTGYVFGFAAILFGTVTAGIGYKSYKCIKSNLEEKLGE